MNEPRLEIDKRIDRLEDNLIQMEQNIERLEKAILSLAEKFETRVSNG